MKPAKDQMELVNAFQAVGTNRGAAALCGTTHKTVKRVVALRAAGNAGEARGAGQDGRDGKAARARRITPHNAALVEDLIAQRVAASDGRITPKRLLPVARAAGDTGLARDLWRAVTTAKAVWKKRRVYRP